MSVATFILGESGTGKSSALRNMDPANTLLLQAVRKPLPFRAAGWKYFDKEVSPDGNIMVTDSSADIIRLMAKTKRSVIIIDDFQYILANEFMRRSDEKGFDKFTDIGRHAWDILTAANNLSEDKRVYILGHTDTDDQGRTRAKTIGKLLNDKITIEGMFTIVLRTIVRDGDYYFATKNNGSDTVKAPMGLFADDLIANDLAAVDAAICEYYNPSPSA